MHLYLTLDPGSGTSAVYHRLASFYHKVKLGEYSSGTGSFPNVITVNMIIVQMNVNSNTIIVQVEYCVYTVTQQAPNLSLCRV